MSTEFEEAFKGTREMIETAAKKIDQCIKKYGMQKEGQKNQLRFATSVLHSACLAASSSKATHYDLYCDILEQDLAPYLVPDIAPTYWSRYLEVLRYYHYLLVNKKQSKEASRVFHYLAALSQPLQSEKDYVFILSTYGQHLMAQRLHATTENGQAEIAQILNHLSKLFRDMLQLNIEHNFYYAELINNFMQYMFVKRSTGVYNYISQLPAQKNVMFETFFKLLARQKMPALSADDLTRLTQSHLDAFTALLDFDIIDKLQQQLAVQHLRACSEQPAIQTDKAIHYMLSLLYYLLKVVYTHSMRKYIEICGKFQGFFQKSAEALLQQQWFLDAIVAITIFQKELHERATQTPFDSFMSGMCSVNAITTHLAFILALIKLTPNIGQSQLMTLQCCKSIRKHMIMQLVTAAITAYTVFLTNCQNLQEAEENIAQTTELQKSLLQIVRYGISTLDTMSCINEEASTLKIFMQRLLQVTVQATTSAQAKLCYKLAEQLICLKAKISNADWITLLRRIYKTTKLLSNQDTSAVLQCCYVATLTMQAPNPDLALLRNQIAIYYNQNNVVTATTTQPLRDKCLLELYECSSSGFKPLLAERQKHLLFSMESQHAIKYYKLHAPLMQSLMSVCPSDYELVLLARACKHQPSAVEQAKRLAMSCETRLLEHRSRLDKLVYAHAQAVLLCAATEAQKQCYTVETKECLENVLLELLSRKQFSDLDIAKELNFVDMALRSLQSFKAFYEESDLAPISSDQALIDWEAIIDDVGTLAAYLQLAGYQEHAMDAWLFQYQLSTQLQDEYSQLRAVAYFCEHCSAVTATFVEFDLASAVASAGTIVLHALPKLSGLIKRFQNYVLLCLCQIAFYHAQQKNYGYVQMLLDCVQLQHDQLSERQGKYDIVLSTLAAVKFRILWLHASSVQQNDQLMQEQFPLWRKCLLQEVETLLEQIPEIVFLSSSDSTSYMILIITLIQQFAECAANRLSVNFIITHIVAVFRLVLHSGLTLRLVQLLAMWMLTNLQMEHIDKAQTKLLLIEHLLGVKRLQDVHQIEQSDCANAAIKKPHIFELPSNEFLAIQPIRKLAQAHLSPVRTNKLQFSPLGQKGNLNRFFSFRNPQFLHASLQWTYFLVGCLNARLYFLIDDFEQLDIFYEQSSDWLKAQQLAAAQPQQLLHRTHINVELLCLQHQVNYLRARGDYEKALAYIDKAINKYTQHITTLDTVYWSNFVLQQQATHAAIEQKNVEKQRQSLNKLRRVLVFNASPEENSEAEQSAKRTPSTLPVKLTNKSERTKQINQRVESSSSAESNESCSEPEIIITSATNASSDELNTCQVIATIDLDDTVNEPSAQTAPSDAARQAKHNTQTVPKSTRKRATSKAKTQAMQSSVLLLDESIELPHAKPVKKDVMELSAEIQHLHLISSAKIQGNGKTGSARPRGRPLVHTNKGSAVIVLEDSPVQRKGKLTRSASTRRDNLNVSAAGHTETPQTRRRAGAVRRAISANIENTEPLPAAELEKRMLKTPATTSRRRMKS